MCMCISRQRKTKTLHINRIATITINRIATVTINIIASIIINRIAPGRQNSKIVSNTKYSY